MTMQQPTTPNSMLRETLTRSMHDHWGLFLAEGFILCVLGLGAIVVPPLAGLATTLFLGWLFLVAGLAGLYFTFRAKSAPGFGWSLLSAVAALGAGALLLWNPFQGLATLTYVLEIHRHRLGVAEQKGRVDHQKQGREQHRAERIDMPQRIEGDASGPPGRVIAENMGHIAMRGFVQGNGQHQG